MNEQQKLTEWFPKTTNPARKGFYQVRFPDGSCGMRWWDACWYYPEEPYTSDHKSMFNSVGGHWRGLASDPKEQA